MTKEARKKLKLKKKKKSNKPRTLPGFEKFLTSTSKPKKLTQTINTKK